MENQTIYVVLSQFDSDPVIGAYTDPEIARKVKIMMGTSIREIKLNHIPPGLIDYAKELGIEL